MEARQDLIVRRTAQLPIQVAIEARLEELGVAAEGPVPSVAQHALHTFARIDRHIQIGPRHIERRSVQLRASDLLINRARQRSVRGTDDARLRHTVEIIHIQARGDHTSRHIQLATKLAAEAHALFKALFVVEPEAALPVIETQLHAGAIKVRAEDVRLKKAERVRIQHRARHVLDLEHLACTMKGFLVVQLGEGRAETGRQSCHIKVAHRQRNAAKQAVVAIDAALHLHVDDAAFFNLELHIHKVGIGSGAEAEGRVAVI